MITGIDLVEWQLRVAAGEPLPLAQSAIPRRGHAIEARLYAEEPERGFLPSIGTITHWRMPRESERVRVDTGFRAGDRVSPYYDPMLAKLVVWAEDRERACAELVGALGECEVAGVATNIAFLERVVAHRAFAGGNVDTGLIDRHRAELFPERGPTPERALVAAAVAEFLARRAAIEAAAAGSDDAHSPWNALDGWSPNRAPAGMAMTYADGEVAHALRVSPLSDGSVRVHVTGRDIVVQVARRDGRLLLADGEARFEASVVFEGEERQVFADGLRRRLRYVDPLLHAGDEEPHVGHLTAPMSGAIVAVFVKPGDRVARGAPLVAVEAMKMEHTIVAPADGVVAAVNCALGDRVGEGADLVDLDEAP
jgi:3-methylcrotonyl-CoA carboxylase alpha subunit